MKLLNVHVHVERNGSTLEVLGIIFANSNETFKSIREIEDSVAKDILYQIILTGEAVLKAKAIPSHLKQEDFYIQEEKLPSGVLYHICKQDFLIALIKDFIEVEIRIGKILLVDQNTINSNIEQSKAQLYSVKVKNPIKSPVFWLEKLNRYILLISQKKWLIRALTSFLILLLAVAYPMLKKQNEHFNNQIQLNSIEENENEKLIEVYSEYVSWEKQHGVERNYTIAYLINEISRDVPKTINWSRVVFNQAPEDEGQLQKPLYVDIYGELTDYSEFSEWIENLKKSSIIKHIEQSELSSKKEDKVNFFIHLDLLANGN